MTIFFVLRAFLLCKSCFGPQLLDRTLLLLYLAEALPRMGRRAVRAMPESWHHHRRVQAACAALRTAGGAR